MSRNATIKLVKGDTYPEVNLTLRDANTGEPSDPNTWTPIDLSAATTTVRVDFRVPGTTAIMATANCVKVSGGAGGQCYFNIPAELTAAEGTYEGEIVIDRNGATETVYDRLTFKVRSRVG